MIQVNCLATPLFPLFDHDCDCCQYAGRFQFGPAKEFQDVWYHGGNDSFIIRSSSDGPDYTCHTADMAIAIAEKYPLSMWRAADTILSLFRPEL